MTKINLLYSNIEIWKEICGYDGDYLISNLGRVKSFKGIDERILKPRKDNHGYLCVGLCKNGKEKYKRIHILMYENFIEKIPEGYVIHHIDFTINNILDNFQMMTKSEHMRLHQTGLKRSEETKKLMSETRKGENHHMFGKNQSEKSKKLMSETRKEKFKNGELNQRGGNNPNVKLTEQKVIKIKIDLDEGILTQKEIGEKFGVNQTTISAIKLGKLWNHTL